MSFRLVPKCRNGHYALNGIMAVISANLIAFGVHGIKVVENIPKLSTTEMYPRVSSF